MKNEYYINGDYIYKRKIKNLCGIHTSVDGNRKPVGTHITRKYWLVEFGIAEDNKLKSFSGLNAWLLNISHRENHFKEQSEFIRDFLGDLIKELKANA